MANTQGINTNSAFRIAMHSAVWPSSGIKAALFLASATVGPSTATYTTTGELTGGSYVAGGIAVNSTTAPAATGSVTYVTPAASLAFPSLTTPSAIDAVQLYDTGQSNRSISVHTFGAQSLTAAPLTLTMPTNDSTNALFRITWS